MNLLKSVLESRLTFMLLKSKKNLTREIYLHSLFKGRQSEEIAQIRKKLI